MYKFLKKSRKVKSERCGKEKSKLSLNYFHTYEAMIESLSVIGKDTIRFLYKQHELFHNIQGEGNKQFHLLFSPTKLNSSEIQPGQIDSISILPSRNTFFCIFLPCSLPEPLAIQSTQPKNEFHQDLLSSMEEPHFYLFPDALCPLVCAVGGSSVGQ